MLDRKLLVEALRVDNKDVLPKFGSSELRKIMEAATEYINIDNIMDYDEGKVTDDGIYSIMDALDRGSVGIADEDGQPALNFMKSGTEIYAHNMFTDEDEVLDATAVALSEYIMDQLETQTFDTNEAATEDATNVIFKREPNEYTDEVDILAVFPDDIEQAGDEGRVSVYSHVGQHSYASPFYIEELEDATPEEYEDLKQELEGQGYQLNVLNGLDQDLPEEAEVPEVNSTLSEEITGNYGLAIGRDIGNDVEILEIREGYNSMEDVQSEINEMEGDYEFQDDPTMMLFAVYTDGISWFNAVTGEEIDYEKAESVNEAEEKRIRITSYDWTRVEDDYEQGEIGVEKSIDFDTVSILLDYSTEEEFKEVVSEYAENVVSMVGLAKYIKENDAIYTEEDRIYISFQTVEDGSLPLPQEIEEWKKGSLKIYSNYLIFTMEKEDGFENESVEKITSLKQARREIAKAKRKLQKKLDAGDFYENFGQAEVRALRNGIPSYADNMDQSEFDAIRKAVEEFADWCATAAPKQESRKNEVSDELKNKVAARRQIDAEIANDAENEILVKHGRNSKEYKKAHAKTNAAIDKLNKFGRRSRDTIKSKEYQAMDDGKYAAPGVDRATKDVKLESAQKSEALSLDELLSMYKEEIDEAKARLDKCYKRAVYRLKENVSYSPEQATPIIAGLATDVRTKSSDVVDEVYRKLG